MTQSPPCRVCGKADDVISYPDDHLLTICPDCCEKTEHPNGEIGHYFYYDRDERARICEACGVNRKYTDYDRD